MKTLTAISLILLPLTAFASEETITINLATDAKKNHVLLDDDVNVINVIMLNLPPSYADDYLLKPNFKTITPKPLSRPAQQNNAGDGSSPLATADSGSMDPCKTLKKNLLKSKTPKKVRELFKTASNGNVSTACIKDLKKTTQTFNTINYKSGYEIDLSVLHTGEEIINYSITKPKTEWLTHVGFSFIYNRGKSYYSDAETTGEGDDKVTVYSIQEQHNQDEVLYGASALFTYPTYTWEGGITQFGWTAGLSANSDTIAVSFGPSLIIKDNILLNLGIVVQEFDELSGIYKKGEIIEGEALDSSVLTKKSFKPSIGITIGFNFGS